MTPPLVRLPAPLAGEWSALLGEHGTLIDAMVEAGQAKQSALVRADRPALERTTRREEELLARAQALEQRRGAMIARTAEALGVPAAGLTIERIAGRAEEAPARTLRALRGALREKGKALQRLNRLNRLLLEQSLGHIQDFLLLLSGRGLEDATYSRAGLERKPAGGTLIVNQVA